MDSMLQRPGLKEGEAIIHPWINKALEKAQQKVEARNFDTRKNRLKYDDVMNHERTVDYTQPRAIMRAPDVHDTAITMPPDVLDPRGTRFIPEKAPPGAMAVSGLHQ